MSRAGRASVARQTAASPVLPGSPKMKRWAAMVQCPSGDQTGQASLTAGPAGGGQGDVAAFHRRVHEVDPEVAAGPSSGRSRPGCRPDPRARSGDHAGPLMSQSGPKSVGLGEAEAARISDPSASNQEEVRPSPRGARADEELRARSAAARRCRSGGASPRSTTVDRRARRAWISMTLPHDVDLVADRDRPAVGRPCDVCVADERGENLPLGSSRRRWRPSGRRIRVVRRTKTICVPSGE